MADGQMERACVGDYCGVNGDGYSGTGWGIWKYENSTSENVNVPIKISGFKNDRVTLVFTNASSGERTLGGDLKPRGAQYYSDGITDDAIFAHPPEKAGIAPDFVQAALVDPPEIIRRRASDETAYYAGETVVYQIGDAHTWTSPVRDDSGGGSKPSDVPATLLAKTEAKDGRTLYIWVEKSDSVQVTATQAQELLAPLLKTYEAVIALTQGQPWGAHNASNLIPENTKDIHFLLQDMIKRDRKNTEGFFYSLNAFTRKGLTDAGVPDRLSNETLIIYLNAASVKSFQDRVISTVAHELTHMINFYERRIRQGDDYAFEHWLEEASSLATEDILAPILFPSGTSSVTPRFHPLTDEYRLSWWMNYAQICSLTTPREGTAVKCQFY